MGWCWGTTTTVWVMIDATIDASEMGSEIGSEIGSETDIGSEINMKRVVRGIDLRGTAAKRTSTDAGPGPLGGGGPGHPTIGPGHPHASHINIGGSGGVVVLVLAWCSVMVGTCNNTGPCCQTQGQDTSRGTSSRGDQPRR